MVVRTKSGDVIEQVELGIYISPLWPLPNLFERTSQFVRCISGLLNPFSVPLLNSFEWTSEFVQCPHALLN